MMLAVFSSIAIGALMIAAFHTFSMFVFALWLFGSGALVLYWSKCPGCSLPLCFRKTGAGGLFAYAYVSWPPKDCTRCGEPLDAR